MDRHVFDDHTTLVLKSLKGLVASHPSLSLIPSIRTVIDAQHDENKVTTICGGGAGHEPGFGGFVGKGLLTAGVSGDIFASPSAKQVYGAIKACPSKKGTILIITNYTGDNLHFGLACQQARADGIRNVAILPVCDDVSVTRTKGALVGRRALAATMIVCKVLGAASEADWGFEETLSLGQALTASIASLACTLEHAHVPGRSDFAHIPDDTLEIGIGLHNEPGVFVVNPRPNSKDLIARMLKLILDQEDKERAFVPFNPGDEVALMVNNMGGMSVLEMYAIVDEVLEQLEPTGIVVSRVFCGTFTTTLNQPGFCLSFLNLTKTSQEGTNVNIAKLLELLDAPQESAEWQTKTYPAPEKLSARSRKEKVLDIKLEEVKKEDSNAPKLKVSPEYIQKILKAGAEAVVAAEPDLTRWDTIVGDGDCGETCKQGAEAVLNAVAKEGLGADGDIVLLLRTLTELIDEACGGTLGAIFSIFLAALAAEVRKEAESSSTQTVDLAFWGKTTTRALQTLFQTTKARVGHRTVMDALIPLCEALGSAKSFKDVEQATKKGGEGTKDLKAKLGRATYVGEKAEGDMPPDPGAMSLVSLTQGMGTVIV